MRMEHYVILSYILVFIQHNKKAMKQRKNRNHDKKTLNDSDGIQDGFYQNSNQTIQEQMRLQQPEATTNTKDGINSGMGGESKDAENKEPINGDGNAPNANNDFA